MALKATMRFWKISSARVFCGISARITPIRVSYMTVPIPATSSITWITSRTGNEKIVSKHEAANHDICSWRHNVMSYFCGIYMRFCFGDDLLLITTCYTLHANPFEARSSNEKSLKGRHAFLTWIIITNKTPFTDRKLQAQNNTAQDDKAFEFPF